MYKSIKVNNIIYFESVLKLITCQMYMVLNRLLMFVVMYKYDNYQLLEKEG